MFARLCGEKETNSGFSFLELSISYIQSTLVISTSLIEVKFWSLFQHGNLRTGNKILWKREISPLFHNIFNISLSSGVKLHIHLLNVVVRFIVFLTSATDI